VPVGAGLPWNAIRAMPPLPRPPALRPLAAPPWPGLRPRIPCGRATEAVRRRATAKAGAAPAMFDTMTLTKVVGASAARCSCSSWAPGWPRPSMWVPRTTWPRARSAPSLRHPRRGGKARRWPRSRSRSSPPSSSRPSPPPTPRRESEFRPCQACHALAEGENRTGPHLFGVVDRPTDAVGGFDYSGALAEATPAWDVNSLTCSSPIPRLRTGHQDELPRHPGRAGPRQPDRLPRQQPRR
jgi:cytochrome c